MTRPPVKRPRVSAPTFKGGLIDIDWDLIRAAWPKSTGGQRLPGRLYRIRPGYLDYQRCSSTIPARIVEVGVADIKKGA